MPCDCEVLGLNPARCWAFSLSIVSVMCSQQVTQEGATVLTVIIINGCLAELLGAKQAQIITDWEFKMSFLLLTHLWILRLIKNS